MFRAKQVCVTTKRKVHLRIAFEPASVSIILTLDSLNTVEILIRLELLGLIFRLE